jgi:hypothetical protein
MGAAVCKRPCRSVTSTVREWIPRTIRMQCIHCRTIQEFNGHHQVSDLKLPANMTMLVGKECKGCNGEISFFQLPKSEELPGIRQGVYHSGIFLRLKSSVALYRRLYDSVSQETKDSLPDAALEMSRFARRIAVARDQGQVMIALFPHHSHRPLVMNWLQNCGVPATAHVTSLGVATIIVLL